MEDTFVSIMINHLGGKRNGGKKNYKRVRFRCTMELTLDKSRSFKSIFETMSKKIDRQATLVVQWLRIHLAMQGIQVRPLVRELISHMPQLRLDEHKK